jgi:hypothetical protein
MVIEEILAWRLLGLSPHCLVQSGTQEGRPLSSFA